MLFALDANSPRCRVFEKLNAELLLFLQNSIKARQFRRTLFSQSTGQECWANAKTQEKFKAVFRNLPKDEAARAGIYNSINRSQNLSELFSDKSVAVPNISPFKLFDALKALTTHLFTRTKDLAGVVREAGESIEQHYQSYVRANSELCYICATSALSHNRFNVADNDQWRSDYDHLLCKDKYPAFSCHPDNFIPTCHICNSKAKGAKDMLFDGARRRKAFYPLPPLNQSFYGKVLVEPIFSGLALFAADGNINPLRTATINYSNPTPDEREMIEVWVGLYQVPKRVGERIATNFCEYIDGDCTPEDFDDFCYQISRKARREPMDIKTTEWRFWWFRLYEWLSAQAEDVKRDAWELIDWKRTQVIINNNAVNTYGSLERE
tara:strand:- start:6911 stop:8050 length:1140 start_codon:yes stop_codon:yes gene_type:complete